MLNSRSPLETVCFSVVFMPLFYIVDIDGRFLICDQNPLAIHRNTEGFGGVNGLGGGTGTSPCKVLVGVHSLDYNAFHYYAVHYGQVQFFRG